MWPVTLDQVVTSFIEKFPHLPSPFYHDKLFVARGNKKASAVVLDIYHPIRQFHEEHFKKNSNPTPKVVVHEWDDDDPLRLPKSIKNFSIKRVIISKHYAYPLIDVALNKTTTYANWAQFFNSVELVKMDANNQPSLNEVFDKIEEMNNTARPQEHEPEPQTRWAIDDLVFVTCQM